MRRTIALVLTVAALLGLSVTSASAVAQLPSGFALSEIDVGQAQYDLTDFVYLPDGGILATGKSGKVTRKRADGSVTVLGSIPVRTEGDLGLTGLAVAQDFVDVGNVYTARALDTPDGKRLRLSRWFVDFSTIGQEQIILDIPGRSDVHAMTGLQVGPDGTLWVSIGDNADFVNVDPLALDALDINKPYGKVLHINTDGSGVAGNPFFDPGQPRSTRSRVYAYGFRSPFRFSLDPVTAQPILGDVGWNTWEEVDRVTPGASYGWPCFEGTHATSYGGLAGCNPLPANAAPLVEYKHGDVGATVYGNSVTGGVVYTGNVYPAVWKDTYVFGDYVSKRLWAKPTGQAPMVLGYDIGGPVKIVNGPNGDIVFANIYSGKIRRLSYVSGNRAPTADILVSTVDPATNTVSIDATASYDLDNDPMTFAYDWGDGTPLEGGPNYGSHRYALPGLYTITVTATDNNGASGSASVQARSDNYAPELHSIFPNAMTYAVGDTVHLEATASDAEDGEVAVTWTTDLQHCPAQQCHSHPSQSYTGTKVDIPFTDHGGDTTLVVKATAKDAAGTVVGSRYEALPRLRVVTVASNWPTSIALNGEDANTLRAVENGLVSVGVGAKSLDGIATFEGWADGTWAAQRTVVVPPRDLALSVTYSTPIDKRYNTDAALRALLGAPTGPEIAEGGTRGRTYANGRLYWTAATGVHEVHGAILGEYLRLGGPAALGAPTTDETKTPDTVGRYNHFAGKGMAASIYWSPGTGAHGIGGAIRQHWAALGWEQGSLGYPTTAETTTPDGQGRFNHFDGHGVGASIYWAPGIGAFEVHGWIRDRWAARGWELGYLGYPVSDEFGTPCGRRSNFQRGWIDFCNGGIYDWPY